jgi:hypothetical protein
MSSQSSTIYFMQWCTCSSWSGCRLVNSRHQMVHHQPSLSAIVIKAYGDLASHLEMWYNMAVLFPNFRKKSKSCRDIKCSYCSIIQQEEIRYSTTSNLTIHTHISFKLWLKGSLPRIYYLCSRFHRCVCHDRDHRILMIVRGYDHIY